MKLKCRINDVNLENYLVQGATFTDNFNETLDSATICIDQVNKLEGLKPYQDVFIWDASETFNGYKNKRDIVYREFTREQEIDKSVIPNWIDVLTFETEEIGGISESGELQAPNIYKHYFKITDYNAAYISSATILNVAPGGYSNTITRINGGTVEGYIYDISSGRSTVNLSLTYTQANIDLNDLFPLTVIKEDSYNVINGAVLSTWIERFNDYDLETISDFRYSKPVIKFSMKCKDGSGNTVDFSELSLKSTTEFLQNDSQIYIYNEYNDQILIQNAIIDFDSGKLKIPYQFINAQNNQIYTVIDITRVWFENYKVRIDYYKTIDLYFKGLDCFDNINFLKGKIKYKSSWSDVLITKTGSGTSAGVKYVDLRIKKDSESILYHDVRFNETSTGYLGVFDEDSLSFPWRFVDDIFLELSSELQHYGAVPNNFFKHFLVDNFTEERLQLGSSFNDSNVKYRYTINLFSETKKLEKIMLPNVSITQSIVSSEKRSCWYYLQQFVNMYSPKYKKVENPNENTWRYIQKYEVSDGINPYFLDSNGKHKNGIVTDLKSIFENVVCPEFSLTNPSLKDVLSQIMICKDIIPFVFNDVIYGLNIGLIDSDQKTFNRLGCGFNTASMSSDNYATDARREYSNAIGQENSCHYIEYLGLRSPNSAFLQLENMVLETRFPIYKINKIKLCYYRKYTLTKGGVATQKVFLCKNDITPLVLQNQVRNALSTNWQVYNDYTNIPGNNWQEKLDYVSKFKLCTIGYDIGSNTISGWGASYEYLNFLWFKSSKTYIENIIKLMDSITDNLGTDIYESELKNLDGDAYITFGSLDSNLSGIVPLQDLRQESEQKISTAARLKSIFFEVDYDAMYNGAIVHDKEYIDDDDITTVDNCSSALTILETDGLFEKEKMNRMSNKIYKFTARYDNDNNGSISSVQELATHDAVTDSTIYTREYQIYDNYILANYEATHEYVLKNYFTSVWAKYRTYSLMSYGESVNRAENRRQLISFSTDSQYYEKEGLLEYNPEVFSKLFSFLTVTNLNLNNGVITNEDQINCGYFYFPEGTRDDGISYGGNFLSDINAFASGNSLCFNLSSYDNVSGGNYISNLKANTDTSLFPTPEEQAEYKATQDWWQTVESNSDAFTPEIGVYVCHLDTSKYFKDRITTESDVYANATKFKEMPKLSSSALNYSSKKIGQNFVINKDNKEKLDFTFQFDYVTTDKNKILFSPWVAKLNDMIGFYKKYEETKRPQKNVYSGTGMQIALYDKKEGSYVTNWTNKGIILKISKTYLDNIIQYEGTPAGAEGVELIGDNNTQVFSYNLDNFTGLGRFLGTQFIYRGESKLTLDKISNVNYNSLKLNGNFRKEVIFEAQDYIAWQKVGEMSSKKTPYLYNLDLTLAKTLERTESGVLYYYYTGTILSAESGQTKSEGKFFGEYIYPQSGGPAFTNTIFKSDKYGPQNTQDFSSENSTIITPNASISGSSYETIPANMVIIASTNPMKQSLVYDSFQLDSNNTCTLPSGMYFQTAGYGGLTSGARVPDVFMLLNDIKAIQVNPQAPGMDLTRNYKSIQYYYKDSKNQLHFVFGVNIDNYEPFNIYLSCVGKRSNKVYDDNHNLVGTNLNYQEEGVTKLYGKEQYYEEVE